MAAAHRNKPGKVRIVGGKWRGRKIPVADVDALRPTPDRVRETVFNWLQGRIDGATCLDLFAGTGILGLEALSRGAGLLVSVERNPRLATALQGNAVALECPGIEVVNADGMDWIRHCERKFDLIFLDPPFTAGLTNAACDALVDCQVLKPGALVYVESEQGLRIDNRKLEILKQSSAGRVQYTLMAFNSE